MRGSLPGRSSSSLTGYSDQIIRGTGEGGQIKRKREEIRKRRRWSFSRDRKEETHVKEELRWDSKNTNPLASLKRKSRNDHDGREGSLDFSLNSLASSVSDVRNHGDLVVEAVAKSVEAYETVPLPPLPPPPLIDDAPRYSSTQHRLMPRSSGSGNAPLIIGATVGGLSFVGILIIAIVVWRRRLKAKERPLAGDNNGMGVEVEVAGRRITVITNPTVVDTGEDKLADLGMMYKSPGSTYGTGASRASSVNNRSRSTPTSPIDKSQIRHHSWTQDENILGSPTPPAIVGAQFGGRIPSRTTTPLSTVSSPSSLGKKSKRSSSLLQRFGGSRDLSSPTSLQTLSTSRGPPPPRPPRPDEGEDSVEEQPQVFELSASPSVRKKRNSKPLPVLPTFLVREHEEEMKRRREEWERERREHYEKQGRPQSPEDNTRKSSPLHAGDPSGYAGGSDEIGMRAIPEEVGLKKVMSLDSLASTTTSSSNDSGDEDDSPGGTRRLSPEVNPLSPRSSQRRPARRESELRPPIPSFANTDAESVATGVDSFMKRTSYLIADGSSGVEATAVAPGFPSPKLGAKLRLTPPLTSSASTNSSSNSSVFGTIAAPVSATTAKPPTLPPPSQSRDESPGAHTRTESTSSGGIAATGAHQDTGGTFMLAGNSSERGLGFASIEDWRESVGETYAGTRPTTAGAASMAPASVEDVSRSNMSIPPVMVDSTAAVVQPRPVFPRRISVDTGVGNMNMHPPPSLAAAGGTFLTPSTATTASARSPFTPIERVPVSAVTAPPDSSKGKMKEQESPRPSTPDREKELSKKAERAPKAPKRKSVPGSSLAQEDEVVQSWLDVGDDSDSDA